MSLELVRVTGTGTGQNSGGTTLDKETATKRTVRRFVVQGEVPVESWGELFRCFVGPAARMDLKKLGLGVQFEMTLPDDGALIGEDAGPTLLPRLSRR